MLRPIFLRNSRDNGARRRRAGKISWTGVGRFRPVALYTERTVRYFTLAQAEQLLPDVERHLRDALFHKAEAQKAQREMEASTQRIRSSGGAQVNLNRQIELRARRDASAASLADAMDRIEQIGALVKDLDIGLIDFMTRFENRDVCLCWRLGESGIGFWHGADEGFRGRKPIEEDFLKGHSATPRETLN